MVKRKDPAVRLEDYKRSLRRWLHLDDDRITGVLVVDNSGAPLAPLQAVADQENIFNRNIEFLSYAEALPPGLHYGYGELGILDFALANSALLDDSGFFVKSTGRLFFPRTPQLLDAVKPPLKFMVDCRSNVSHVRNRTSLVTMQLMLFDVHFYREILIGRRSLMSTEWGKSHAEHLLYDALIGFQQTAGAHLRFPINVEPEGVGAHWDKQYGGLAPRSKAVIRSVARRVAPGVWI